MLHNYGYKPDPEDKRDFVFQAIQKVEQLPPSVDMRQYCSPVREQGKLGACSGFAIGTGLREFIILKNLPPPPPLPVKKRSCLLTLLPESLLMKLGMVEFVTLSPMFLYYMERVLENTVNEDRGATMRSGMKVLCDTGICSETHYPYDIEHFNAKPGLAARTEAINYKVSAYSRVMGLTNMKSCLALGGGLVLGMYVYESFETPEVARTGIMPVPRQTEQLLGGHAVFCCGYVDDTTWPGGGYLIIKNSWGTSWGQGGYFLMPYEYAGNYSNVPDVWTVTV